jgi:hypothetical protein
MCSEVVSERTQYCHLSWTLTTLMDWLLEWYWKSLRSILPDKNEMWSEPGGTRHLRTGRETAKFVRTNTNPHAGAILVPEDDA